MTVLLIMNIFTFFLLNFIGYACFKMQSNYPNTKVGYHLSWAMKDKDIWTKTNKLVGLLCVILSIIPFLLLPIFFYVIELNVNVQILIYFVELVLYTLIIVFLPKKLIKQYKNL